MSSSEKSRAELEEELRDARHRIAALEAFGEHAQTSAAPLEMLRALLQNIPDFIYFKDRRRRFVLASQAFCGLLGRELPEILGRRDEELFPPEVAALTVPDDERVIAGQPIVNRVEGNDELRWVLTTKLPWRDADGEIIGLLGLSRDITERKHAEDELARQQQRTYEAQRLESLGTLAAGVAHDFNNLLSTILANADLARLDCERGSERARALERITTATRHAAELTDQLLNYVGRGIRSEEALALNEIIEGTRELFRASLPKDGRLFTTLASGLPPVRGDRSMLRQVAMNLMLNAAEALRGPGEIRVTTALETVTESELVAVRGGELPPGRYVVLRVADTGCGMDEQTLSRIFDPFFSTKFTGRGLGLAATLGIAREHRGGIAVRSRAGEGTEFAVFLPPDELPGEAPRELARPDATRWETSGVALLADDEAYVREALAAVLRRAGMEVIEVDNGAAAVLAFSRGVDRFRIVILDQIMPVMSGSEAMEAIRAMRADVPIVLTSGYTEDAIRLDPGAAPAHHFLRKPFGVRDIESIVREALGE